MELRVRDVARLLNVSEQTIYRWIRSGSLPAHRIHDQYMFHRVELQEWAALHEHRVSPELLAGNGASEEVSSLSAAIGRGGIFYDIPGERREDVLQAVSRLPGIPPRVDRQLLHQLLAAREALASTGIGNGIAIPHPRDPVVVHTDEPVVLVCFLRRPIDFHALDGRPVRVLFVLLSPSVRVHLQMFARLAFALHDDALQSLLERTAPREEILDRLRAIEEEARAAAARSE